MGVSLESHANKITGQRLTNEQITIDEYKNNDLMPWSFRLESCIFN